MFIPFGICYDLGDACKGAGLANGPQLLQSSRNEMAAIKIQGAEAE